MAFHVYVTSNEVPEEALDIVRQVAEVKVNDSDGTPSREVLLREVVDVDGLFCNINEKIDAQLMDAGKKLKVVASMSVGFDHIDQAAATARSIMTTNTPGVLTEAVADETLALMLDVSRRIAEADKYVRAGKWKIKWTPMLMVGRDVYGKTLGIYGLGRIGVAVANRARGFNMKVIYYDVFRNQELEKKHGIEFKSKEEVLRESDFFSVHVPLLPETRNSIGAKELAMMKRTAFLINTARGGVVDEKALIEALQAGTIAGAGLDVFEKEPIEIDNPLLKMDNVVLAPHLASGSIESRTAMAVLAAKNLVAALQGELPTNLLNKDSYRGKPNPASKS
ncbi:MAG: D-glycerate dehydrogenase [Thaumarchaeota archaeon]|nr:D-glycerate dehydrogenase [Nitrososphaerota archaeon]